MADEISVAFVMSSISRAGGGITSSALRLAQTLAKQATIEVFGLADDFAREDLPLWKPLLPKVCAVRGPRALGFAPGLRTALRDSRADLVHHHGLWTYPSHVTRQAGKPYLVSPHGMLDPWALQHSGWKKKIAAFVFQNAHLRDAACMHALCDAEAEAMRAYGLRNPISVIPNGVDLPAGRSNLPAPWAEIFSPEKKCMLYLGRIHPKKNLANLLRAWRQNIAPEWRLVIAGWDQNNHESELRSLARELKIEAQVHFAGPLFGKAKAAAYEHAATFILPSVSEGLPMTVLEAWSHETPVLMTPECHLPEGYAAHAAMRITSDVGGLASGLEELFKQANESRAAMGRRGRELVEKRFSWEKISREMLAIYAWILCGGAPPESLRF